MIFSIKIIDEKIRECCGMPCCIGEIQIGEFKEDFEMPLEYWTIEDYKKQWKDGIERLNKNERSCLVAEVQDPEKAPWASLWVLYKEGDTVHVQNHVLRDKRFMKLIKKQPFTLETCYNLITPREVISAGTGMEISEWITDLGSINEFLAKNEF